MPPPHAPTSIRCGDCEGWQVLPEDADSPRLLGVVRAFLAEHSGCVFNMTISVPLQRTAAPSHHGGG